MTKTSPYLRPIKYISRNKRRIKKEKCSRCGVPLIKLWGKTQIWSKRVRKISGRADSRRYYCDKCKKIIYDEAPRTMEQVLPPFTPQPPYMGEGEGVQ